MSGAGNWYLLSISGYCQLSVKPGMGRNDAKGGQDEGIYFAKFKLYYFFFLSVHDKCGVAHCQGFHFLMPKVLAISNSGCIEITLNIVTTAFQQLQQPVSSLQGVRTYQYMLGQKIHIDILSLL